MAVVKATQKQVVRLYRKMKSANKVAKHLGCSIETVRNYLKRAGVLCNLGRSGPHKSLKQTLDEVKVLYLKMESIVKVAKHLGCTSRTVANYLEKAGQARVFIEKGWNTPIQLDPQKVLETYHRVKGCPKTAEVFGCSDTTIRKCLQKIGQPLIYACCNNEATQFKKGHTPHHKGKAAPWVTGERHPLWRGGISKKIGTCPDCGKKLKSCRAVRCASCATKYVFRDPTKNPNWKGGISFEPYPVEWTTAFKKSIRQRDGYKCRLCGKSQQKNGRALSVHHIDYDKENLDPRNLISLCDPCHGKTNSSKRRHWTRFLKKKMKGVA